MTPLPFPLVTHRQNVIDFDTARRKVVPMRGADMARATRDKDAAYTDLGAWLDGQGNQPEPNNRGGLIAIVILALVPWIVLAVTYLPDLLAWVVL